MKKKIFILISITLFIAYKFLFELTSFAEIPKLMSTMRSKEFCSCYFILSKPRDFCLNSVKKGYPLFDFNIDEVKREVSFSNLMGSTTFIAGEERYGCQRKADTI